jgi:hypothetical protein
MSVDEILERERRWAVPTAVAAILTAAFLFGSLAVQGSVDLPRSSHEAALLRAVDANYGTLLIGGILAGAGLALMVAPLLYLFSAAAARTERVRRGLVGLTIAGPIFLAAHSVLNWPALLSASHDFGHVAHHTDKVAKNLLSDSTFVNVALGLKTAGVLGLAFSMLYVSLWAMRTGLLTRFWGTLGMALGPSLLLLPFGLYGVLLWFVAMGALIAGWWRGPRPPAWETGVEIPWPSPGEQIVAQDIPPDPIEQDGGEGAKPVPSGPKRKRKRRR